MILHALIFGFLPFNSNDKATLEHQILNEELDYNHIKKLKTSSIKIEFRKALNILLKSTSDELIDLIERMLKKDPEQRIDNFEVFEHPWIKRYKNKDDYWSDDDDDDTDGEARSKRDKSSSETNSDIFGDNQQETNVDSDPVQLDNKSSRGTSSPNSFLNSEVDKGKGGRGHIDKSILQNHYMFNIEEHDNETTGNFVHVDLKQRKPIPQASNHSHLPNQNHSKDGAGDDRQHALNPRKQYTTKRTSKQNVR